MPITYHPHQGRTVQKAVESEVPVQQSVSAYSEIAISVSKSPVSEVGLSTQAELEVVSELSLSSAISVGQVVEASADTAIQVSVSPTSAVSVSSTQESVVFATVEVSTSIPVEQAVGASTDTAIQVSASPTSAVDLSSTETKEVEYPVYERTATSTVDVGQSVSATTDTSVQVSASPSSAVGVSSSTSSEKFYSIFEGFTRDARWDSVGTTYTDLDGATKATAHIQADVGLGDTGILMEHGAEGDGLAVAVVTDEDGSGNELRGTERILAMFGEGSTTTGTDTAVLDHRLGYRIKGVDTTPDNYSTTLKGDWRDDIEEGYEIGWESESEDDTVDAVTYSSANNETTIEHSYRAGASSDTVYFVQDQVQVTWSADTGVGQCVLYEDGTPVDTDPIQNSRLCGGNDGTIGDEEGNTRVLGQGWTSLDCDYENTVHFADIYLGETTPQVVSEYRTEDLSVTPAIYRSAGLRYGQDEQGNQTVVLGRVSSARAYVNINADPGVEDGIVAHWGADVDGTILYMHDGNLYLQVGDGGTVGGSAECIVFDIEDGAHIIEWTANIPAQELQLWVDGVKEDTATGWSYGEDLAGGEPDGIGRQKSNIPVNRGDFSVSGGRLNRDVKKAETFEGASWIAIEQTASSTVNVGQSVSASTDTSSLSSVSPTSSVGVSSSVTTEVDTPTNTAPTASLTVTDDPSGDLVVEADAQGSSDPDNDSLTFDYDWGDGTTDTGAGSIATHTYSSEGTYTVTVTVDDGTATDQASQDVTVSTSSSGSEVVHDFEGGDEGWVSVASGFGRTTTYARNGSYSYGGGVDSAQAGELAYVEPPELSGGNKIESLTYHWLEEVFSYGGGVRLYDSSGSSVIGFLTDNPQWKVLNGSGSITQLYDGGGAYEDWIKVEVTFDWSAGTADVTYTNESTGTSRTENGVSIGGNGVEKIQLTNHNGESFGSGNCYYWVDDLQFTPSTSTSGPSFNDGVEESFTKEGSNTASHDASWDGSAAPYSFRIYKDSSKQTLIYSNALVYNTSDNQSNYTTSTSINDLTFGSTVYFEVTDNNGNSSTTSVSTSVAF